MGRRLGGSLINPGVVVGDLHTQFAAVLESVDAGIVSASQEGVELGGNVLEAHVDGRSTLVDNLLNLLTGQLGSNGVSLNVHIDGGRVIVVIGFRLFLTGDLDFGTSLFAESGNVGTSTTDDVSADRERNGDLDCLLLVVSIASAI